MRKAYTPVGGGSEGAPLRALKLMGQLKGRITGEKKERPVLRSKTDGEQRSRELCSGQEGGGEALSRGLAAGREDTPQ